MPGPTPFDDILTGTSGNDIIDGLAGNDRIEGLGGADRLSGGIGNDVLIGGAGNDILNGGDGSDTYVFAQGDGLDAITDTGASGTDTIVAAGDNVAITLRTGFGAANGIEVISAGGFTNVTILGGAGADNYNFSTVSLVGIAAIDGGAGNDTITGSAGADTIIGGLGNDTLRGGDGSDTYLVGQGDGLDVYADTGASGTDTIQASDNDVAITLRTGFSSANGIEAINANGFANVTIMGSAAADVYNFSAVALTGISAIEGGAGNDAITGSAGADTIDGGAGNDTLNGGAGSDTYLVSQSDGLDVYSDTGASGTDTIQATGNDIAITLRTGFGAANGIEAISADGYENVTILGGAGADIFNFSAVSLTGIAAIDGAAGADAITGSVGADTINGGAANDTLNGGEGSDTYLFAQGDGIDVITDSGASGSDSILASSDDVAITLRSSFGAANGIEQIGAGGHINVTILGAATADIYDFSAISLTDIAAIDGAAGNDAITGSTGNDRIIGGLGIDNLLGNAGDDTVEGGTGNDTVNGGEGSDTYVFAQGDGLDTVADSGASGLDQIVAAGDGVEITLRSGFGAANGIEAISADGYTGVTILGGIAADAYNFSTISLTGIAAIDGAAGNDSITGSSASDTIIGGTGNDILNGGDGSDTYLFSQGDGLDVITDTGVSGSDAIRAAGDNVAITLRNVFGAANGIESISSGGNANVTIQGGIGADNYNFSTISLDGIASIDGGAGNDTLTGSAGADTMSGGDGNDVLAGGAGNDTVTYAGAGASVTVTLLSIANQNTGGAGIDRLSGFENIVGSNFSDTLTGDANANRISGGEGDDQMTGGAGADTFIFASLADLSATGDQINDFGAASDQIDLSAIAGLSFIGSSAFTNIAGQVRFEFNAGTTRVQIDSDGDGAADHLLTILNGQFTLSETATGSLILRSLNSINGTANSDNLVGTNNAEAISALASDDFVQGRGGDDVIYGGDGNDTLNGDGASFYNGPSGDDRLYGEAGDDYLRGGAGTDTFDGGAGFDRISFYTASATQGVIANLTTQTIANDGFGNAETMTSIEAFGQGTAFADHFTGDAANNLFLVANGDTVVALGGDDTFQLDGAPVLLDGGEGNDTITLFTGTRLVPDNTGDGLAELETATLGVVVDLSIGQIVNDGFGLSGALIGIENVGGSNLADAITGDAGDNRLNGGAGNDTLTGGGGNDRLAGGGDDDVLTGGAGADVYAFDSLDDLTAIGDQVSDFELGSDTLDFSAIAGLTFIGTGAFSNVAGEMRYEWIGGATAILIDANGDGTADDRVVLSGVEAILAETAPGSKILLSAADIIGTPNADILNGTSLGEHIFGLGGNDTIDAGEGNDVVAGGGGNDTINGGGGTDLLTFAFDTFRSQGVYVDLSANVANDLSFVETDTLSNFENVDGTLFADEIYGSSGDNVLRGLDGDDNLLGGLGNDSIQGGNGFDTALYNFANSGGVTVDLRLQGAAQNTVGAGTDTLSGIESVLGSNFADTLTGDDSDNSLNGLGGDDVLDGLGGIDNLFGGNGNDTMLGGEGNDFFRGGAGNDTMNGGNGQDRVSMFGATAGATVDLNIQGVAQNTVSQGMDTLISIEDVSGSVHNDILTGNSGDNWLWGNLGADTLTGGDGNDLFWGDGGTTSTVFSDIIAGGNGIDTISYADNGTRANGVTVNLSAGTGGDAAAGESDSLSGIENVDGTQFADNITGDGNANVLAGLAGDDMLTGGSGNDVLAFRSLDDMSAVGDTVTDFQNGSDTLDFSAIAGLTFIGSAAFSNVAGQMRYELGVSSTTILIDANGDGVADDRVVLNAVKAILVETAPGSKILRSAADIVGTPNPDVLNGTAEGERIFGLGSNDTINAGNGNDILDGGVGSDILNGGDGDDTIVIADLGSNDQVNGGTGYDTLDVRTLTATNWNFTWSGMERFLGSEFNDNVFGSDLEVIDQSLYGNGGNDILRGGGGNDLMDGGAGDDQFRGGSGVDSFIGGEGNDRISFFESRATQAVVANLMTQTVSNDGFGNAETMTSIEGLGAGTAFADTFIGNNDANFLLGNTGDTITALDGDDSFQLEGAPGVIDGGAGNDTITVFTGSRMVADFTGDGVADTVNAATGVVVDLSLGQIVNDGFGLSGALISVENVGGSVLADTLTGDTGANRLSGSLGNDILAGGGGNDRLAGGGDDDMLTGGAGSDVFAFEALDDLTAAGDTIVDFEIGADTLDFSAVAGLTFIGTAAFSNVAGQLRYEMGGGRTTVLIDADGNGVADDRVVITNVETYLVETAPGSKILRTPADIVGTPNADILNGTADGERIFGLENNDTINAGGGNDRVEGGAGNDTMDGGTGIDTLSYSGDTFRIEGVFVDLRSNFASTLSGSGEVDTISNFEIVEGTDFADTMFSATSISSVLRGFGGADTLFGPSGAGPATLDGGDGIDTASYSSFGVLQFPAGVTVDLRLQGAAQTIGAAQVTLLNIENLNGSSTNDTLTGDGNANALNGLNGNDVLDGQGGIDNLFGGNGNDTMLGGEGNDFFRGGAGNDTLNGGNGQDRVSLFGAASAGTIDLNIQGVAQDTLSQGIDTLISIEDASGTAFNDVLIGNTGDNWLWGNEGADTLTGGDGNDLFWGDGSSSILANDTISGGNGVDTISYFDNNTRTNGVTVDLNAGTGGDLAAGESDSLSSIENVEGSNFADIIVGDANANVLSGLAGNDTLTGGAGADRFVFEAPAVLNGSPNPVTQTIVDASAAEGDVFAFSFSLAGYRLADGSALDDGDVIQSGALLGGGQMSVVRNGFDIVFDTDGNGVADLLLDNTAANPFAALTYNLADGAFVLG